MSDSKTFEDWRVVFRGESAPAVWVFGGRRWARESKELPRDNPIHVTVFHLLVELILLIVEVFVVVPAQFNAVLETAQTVKNLNRYARSPTVHL